GINNTAAGPFSRQLNEWSVFNVGLQLDLIKTNLQTVLSGGAAPCTSIPSLPNGIQIFPGSAPLYKNGVLVGAIGVSGDGVDQDDLIAAGGNAGFAAPVAIRSDQVFVRGVRLLKVKYKSGDATKALARKRFFLVRGSLDDNKFLIENIKQTAVMSRDCFYRSKSASEALMKWLKEGDCESVYCREIEERY